MLNAYWWSPRRDLFALRSEVQYNPMAWLRMSLRGGGFSNFGDELSRRVLHEVTGRAVGWAPIDRAEVIGIGSIIELYLARGGKGYIWGAGLRDEGQIGGLASESILAVRGELTRTALRLAPALVSLGDPGLVAKTFFDRRGPKSGALVLPHFAAFRSRTGARAIGKLRTAGCRVMVPSAPVDQVCNAIARADHVFTSSLHGLVVADALGTPATLVEFTRTLEPAQKYDDYNSVYGIKANFAHLTDVLSVGGRKKALEKARERMEMIGPRVDDVIEGLYRAARPLR